MKKLAAQVLMLIVVVVLSAGAAAADEIPWTYVEAGYLSVDPDNVSGSGDNWFAGGSVGFLKHFHAFARYIDGDYGTNVDLTYWEVGAGWHGLLGDKADIVGELTWIDTEVGGVSDDGYQVTGGVRWVPVKMFELDGFVNWADLDQGGSDMSYEARAIVNIWRIGIGASYEILDDAEQWNIFARFNFGMN